MKTLLTTGVLLIAWTAAPAAQPSDGNEIPRDVWGRPHWRGSGTSRPTFRWSGRNDSASGSS